MTNELLDLAARIAAEAAELATRRRREGVEVAARKSSAVDVVTHADREVEALIRGRLADARPNDAFFGEESGASAPASAPGDAGASTGSGLTWVVDPIDGTVNYLYGMPWSAVSIAVVEGAVELVPDTVAGAVANLGSGELALAARGEGATVGGAPVHPLVAPPLAETLLATGFSYDADARRRQALLLTEVLGEVRDIRRMGAAALDLVSIAAGRVDAFFEAFLNPWDVAAGILAVREAGGTAVAHDTGDLLGPVLVAGHRQSVDALRDLIDRAADTVARHGR